MISLLNYTIQFDKYTKSIQKLDLVAGTNIYKIAEVMCENAQFKI